MLVVSSACAEGAATTVQALALGAADTLVKPGAGTSHARFAEQLVEKLARLMGGDEPAVSIPTALPARPVAVARPVRSSPERPPLDVVAIGASTGGIHALSALLRALPASVTAPIVITQHLPATFMPFFAAQVASIADRPCEVATDRLRLRPGRIVVAPGDAHLVCMSLGEGALSVRLSAEPAASGCLPSVDVMFESVAAACGGRSLAVVLSGMGRDGEIGARALAAVGAGVVVQDRETSVVWGMPGVVAATGLAQAVLPPAAIARYVADCWNAR